MKDTKLLIAMVGKVWTTPRLRCHEVNLCSILDFASRSQTCLMK